MVLASLSLSLGMVGCETGRQLARHDDGGAHDGATGSGGRTDAGTATGGGTGAGGAGGSGVGGRTGIGGTTGTGGAAGRGMGGTPGSGGLVGSGGTPGVGGRTGVGGTGVGGAIAPAMLVGSILRDFPIQEVGVTSAAVTWSITNNGDVATGTLALLDGATGQLTTTNGCGTTLAGHSSCSIMVAFRPTVVGGFSGTLTLSAGTGGTVTFSATGTGGYRLTLTKGGSGTGTVTSAPAGLSCGTTCSFLTTGTNFTLQARTSNGSGAFFSGWSGGGCTGPARDCTITLSGSVNVTATFSAMTANLVFVTSLTFPSDRGRAAAYDATCNTVATAAGINDATGGAFTAMTSDVSSTGRTRLVSARGWVRMDGRPFGDTVASLFTTGAVFNVIRYNENGLIQSSVTGAFAMTGTDTTGGASIANCSNFTNPNDPLLEGGSSELGPGHWIGGSGTTCTGAFPIICMGHTKITAVSPTVSAGKKIWISNAPFTVGGGQTPDATCQANRPAGVTTAVALIATTTRAASAVLVPASTYVRPDGTLVAAGSALVARADLESGIWQSGDLVYRGADGAHAGDVDVWTGQNALATPGSIATTCGNWTDPNQTGAIIGGFLNAQAPYWWTTIAVGCSEAGRNVFLYCVQTAP